MNVIICVIAGTLVATIVFLLCNLSSPLILDIIFPLEEPRPKIYIHITELNFYLQDHHITLILYSCFCLSLGVMYCLAYLTMMDLFTAHAGARLDILRWAFPLNNSNTNSEIDLICCIGSISLQLEKLITMNAFGKMLKNAWKYTRTLRGSLLLIFTGNSFHINFDMKRCMIILYSS